MASGPTSRTLVWLRDHGYIAAVTERWNEYARIRQDLLGFIDVIGIRPDQPGVLAVQATSGSNAAARVAKIREIEAARVWLKAGNRILVIGWRQLVARKKDGSKSKVKRWTPRVVEVTLTTEIDNGDGQRQEAGRLNGVAGEGAEVDLTLKSGGMA